MGGFYMENLMDLRSKIDDYNVALLKLLNERAKIAIEIGKAKEGLDIPTHDPIREAKILQELTDLNEGPLTNSMVEKIFTEIMKANLLLQQMD